MKRGSASRAGPPEPRGTPTAEAAPGPQEARTLSESLAHGPFSIIVILEKPHVLLHPDPTLNFCFNV